jgi:hypothetical protein
MPILNEHKEFHPVDTENDWHVPPAYPPGIEQKILSGRLDEKARTGRRTRLLRFHPGARTTRPFVHDYFEEVYLLAGDLVVGDEATGGTAVTFGTGTYACRPPGIHHGPFRSEKGCLLLEIHYYDH